VDDGGDAQNRCCRNQCGAGCLQCRSPPPSLWATLTLAAVSEWLDPVAQGVHRLPAEAGKGDAEVLPGAHLCRAGREGAVRSFHWLNYCLFFCLSIAVECVLERKSLALAEEAPCVHLPANRRFAYRVSSLCGWCSQRMQRSCRLSHPAASAQSPNLLPSHLDSLPYVQVLRLDEGQRDHQWAVGHVRLRGGIADRIRHRRRLPAPVRPFLTLGFRVGPSLCHSVTHTHTNCSLFFSVFVSNGSSPIASRHSVAHTHTAFARLPGSASWRPTLASSTSTEPVPGFRRSSEAALSRAEHVGSDAFGLSGSPTPQRNDGSLHSRAGGCCETLTNDKLGYLCRAIKRT